MLSLLRKEKGWGEGHLAPSTARASEIQARFSILPFLPLAGHGINEQQKTGLFFFSLKQF